MHAKRRELQEATARYLQEKQMYEKIKKRRRRGLYRRLSAYSIITAALSVAFLFTFLSQNELIEEKLSEREKLNQEMAEMLELEQQLREEVERLHDPEYIGEIARRDFFLSKEGELIFKLPSASSAN